MVHPSSLATVISSTSITSTTIRRTLSTALVRSPGMDLPAIAGLGSVDMGASAGADDAERRMRFGHAQPDKMSFVDAVASTHLRRIRWRVRLCC
jgi:hypothetical protein